MNAFDAADLATRAALEVLGDRLFAGVQYGSALWDPEGPSTDVDLHLIVTARAAVPAEDLERLRVALRAAASESGIEHDLWVLALDELDEEAPRDLLQAPTRDTSWALHRRHWLAGRRRMTFGPGVETWTTLPTREQTQRALEAELAYCIRAAEHADRDTWPLLPAYLVRQCCRLLCSDSRGEVVLSKSEATAWARASLEPAWQPLIDAADAAYEGATHDEALLRADADRFLAWTRATLGWTPQLQIFGVRGIPEIITGTDLASVICGYAQLEHRDVVVVAQKIVSKAEGRMLPITQPDAVARETRRIVAQRDDVVIVETHHGFVCANAGVDRSNAPDGMSVLLPEDADASAERIRVGILERTGARVGVIVADTFGRPWRMGQVNVALGVAGMAPLRDLRGSLDRAGREMESTILADADELASAAELVMGKVEGVPVAIVRGLWSLGAPGTGHELIRPADEDLFPVGLGGSLPGR